MKAFNFTAILILLPIVFTIGLWSMDMGISLQFLKLQGANVIAQSLLLGSVEPRIIYHAGIVTVLGTFMASLSLACFLRFGDD